MTEHVGIGQKTLRRTSKIMSSRVHLSCDPTQLAPTVNLALNCQAQVICPRGLRYRSEDAAAVQCMAQHLRLAGTALKAPFFLVTAHSKAFCQILERHLFDKPLTVRILPEWTMRCDDSYSIKVLAQMVHDRSVSAVVIDHLADTCFVEYALRYAELLAANVTVPINVAIWGLG